MARHCYAINGNNPMFGEWRLQFIDNPIEAQNFLNAFNNILDPNDDNNNQNGDGIMILMKKRMYYVN